MAPQQKRAAQEPAAGMPEAKRRVASLLKQQGLAASTLKTVAEVLDHPLAEGLSGTCRQMLSAMLPFALCVPSDLRGEHQVMCVSMLGEVIEGTEAKMQEAINDVMGHAAAADVQKAVLLSKVGEVETVFATVAASASRCKNAMAEVVGVLAGKQQALSERQEDQRKDAVEHALCQADRTEFECLSTGSFAAVQSGAGGAADYTDVEAVAGKLGLDESLVFALPSALRKQLSERGSFDQMVFEQFADKLHSKIAALGARIETEGAAMTLRADGVTAAIADVEAATAAKEEAAEQLRSAIKAVVHAADSVDAATATLVNHESKCACAAETNRAREQDLASFQATVRCAYVQLRDRVSAKREKELAAVDPERVLEVAMPAVQAGA